MKIKIDLVRLVLIIIVKIKRRVRRRQMAAEMCPHWNIPCVIFKKHMVTEEFCFLSLIFSGVLFLCVCVCVCVCKPLLTKKLMKMAKRGLLSDKTGTARFKYKAFFIACEMTSGRQQQAVCKLKERCHFIYSIYLFTTCSHFRFRCFKNKIIFLVFFSSFFFFSSI